MPSQTIMRSSWDQATRSQTQRIKPAPFVNDIITTISAYGLLDGNGYYPNCGRDDNFAALWQAGLSVDGSDVSQEAIDQLAAESPEAKTYLRVGDFFDTPARQQYDYLIASRLFQGSNDNIQQYFQHAKGLLKPLGILFLRVSSINTSLYRQHELINRNSFGSKSIRYSEGADAGQITHLYSAEELCSILGRDFTVLMPLREAAGRVEDEYRVMWETIVQKI